MKGWWRLSIAVLAMALAATGCRESKEIVEDYADAVVIRAPNSARMTRMSSDLQQIRVSITFFQGVHGRYPASLQELAQKGTLQRIPPETMGGEWVYDPDTGKVHSSTHPEL